MLEIMIWTKDGGYCTSSLTKFTEITSLVCIIEDGIINFEKTLIGSNYKFGWLPKNDIWQGQAAIAIDVDLPKCVKQIYP